jgi:hypothetical protein
MNLKLSRDSKRGAGYAIVEATDAGVSADGLQLCISRPGQEQPYLGPSGWQAAGAHVPPENVEVSGGKLVIELGPSIVRHMMQANFKVHLKDGAGVESKAASLPWRGIPAYSGPIGGAQHPATAPLVEPEPPPQPQTGEGGEPVGEPPIQQGGEPDPGPGEPLGAKGGKGIIIAVVAGLLVVAAVAVVAYDFISEDKPGQTSGDKPDPIVQVPAPSPLQPTITSGLDEFLKTGPSTEETFRRAKKALKDGRGADAMKLLVYGGRKGHQPSRMLWGKVMDPSAPDRPEADGLPAPSANQAFDLYSQTAKEGSADACREFNRLRAWIEEEAATGDPTAQMLLTLAKGVQC